MVAGCKSELRKARPLVLAQSAGTLKAKDTRRSLGRHAKLGAELLAEVTPAPTEFLCELSHRHTGEVDRSWGWFLARGLPLVRFTRLSEKWIEAQEDDKHPAVTNLGKARQSTAKVIWLIL